MFIARKKSAKITKVNIGFCGASEARNIIGKSKTIAGRF
jgi:hypothetical protein